MPRPQAGLRKALARCQSPSRRQPRNLIRSTYLLPSELVTVAGNDQADHGPKNMGTQEETRIVPTVTQNIASVSPRAGGRQPPETPGPILSASTHPSFDVRPHFQLQPTGASLHSAAFRQLHITLPIPVFPSSKESRLPPIPTPASCSHQPPSPLSFSFPGDTQNNTEFLSPKHNLINKKAIPCSNIRLGAPRPWHEGRQLEKALINDQSGVNPPLTTSYPIKRLIPGFGESYPVTPGSPASQNIHKPTAACGPFPVSRQRGPSTGPPQHKFHSLKRTVSRPPIHLTPEPTGQRQFPPSTL